MERQELKSEVKKHSKAKKKDIAMYFLIGLACIALVFSFVQSFQISDLKTDMALGNVAVSGQAVAAQAPASGGSAGIIPQRSAPVMVGGC
jgi:hypothetical protein